VDISCTETTLVKNEDEAIELASVEKIFQKPNYLNIFLVKANRGSETESNDKR